MDKGYIAPEAALKKLRAARGIRQAVYIYGATGYGKTELAKQYLHNRRYRYISCAEDAAALLELAGSGPYGGRKKQKETGNESQAVAVLDDLHLLKSAEGRNAVLTLTQMQGLWLILIGRSPVPSWLMPSYVGGGFIVVTEDDLCLKEKDIAFYMETQGIALTGEELAFVCEKSRGNAYIVRHAALKIREGMRPGPGMQQEISDAFAEYLEGHVLVQWDSELLEFLMQVSVAEEFCRARKEVGMSCTSCSYREDKLMEICAGMMGTGGFDAAAFENLVKLITALPDGSLEVQFFGGETKRWEMPP